MGVVRNNGKAEKKSFKYGVARFARHQKAALNCFFRNGGLEGSGGELIPCFFGGGSSNRRSGQDLMCNARAPTGR